MTKGNTAEKTGTLPAAEPGTARPPSACAWCQASITQAPAGRFRRYCRPGCRQRAYEARRTERAVATVTREREWAAWHLARLRDDLDELVAEIEPGLHDPVIEVSDDGRRYAQAVIDLADPLWRLTRHGPPPVRLPTRATPRYGEEDGSGPG